ncbi:hypothetical protein PV325_014152 [Microctonus aethiopoides]|nr:hypothetical protein PV325_014152 [Microctonus aethiopoides]
MYSPPGVKEKFVARVCAPDEKIRVTRGFNFIGTGRFADLPDTRLRVDVEELFKNLRCVGNARYNIALSAPTRRFNIRKQDGSPDPDSRVIVIFDVQCLSEVSLTTFGNLSLVEAPRTRRNAKAPAPTGRDAAAVASEKPKKKRERENPKRDIVSYCIGKRNSIIK